MRFANEACVDKERPYVERRATIFTRTNLQTLLIWAILCGLLYTLRSLFPVIFLTFILCYIGNTIMKFIERWVSHRRAALAGIYLIFILALVGMVYTVLPRLHKEALQFAKQYIATAEHASADSGGDTVVEVGVADTTLARAHRDTTAKSAIGREVREVVDKFGGRMLGDESYSKFRESEAYVQLIMKSEQSLVDFVPKLVSTITSAVRHLGTLILQFFLAIIFSFLILWDLPRISEDIKVFSRGRSADVYAAVAPALRSLGMMIGKAFEAQTGIGMVNALLTSIGFWILGIPSIALLAVIVFFCSYIPVLGVFISTIPAALLAIQIGGFMHVVWIIVMVAIVHAVEAYGLNPLIYGHHMSMHPVAVLIILLVAEHLFGVWGLLLGVPVSAFLVEFVVKGNEVSQ